MLAWLRRKIAARWIGFEEYKGHRKKLNGWSIDKGRWIVVRKVLLHLKPDGFK